MADLSALSAVASATYGAPPVEIRSLHGGDLSEVRLLIFPDGRNVVAKIGPLVDREARMLRHMRDAGAPVPSVQGLTGDVLFLEAIEELPASAAGWAALGAGLRKLHSTTGPEFGWNEDYAFGDVRIANAPTSDWPAFWAERRLLPCVPHLPRGLAHRVEAIAARLADVLPGRPPAVLLHGDLWTGNVLFGAVGGAHLIDPACYHGHAEVDLAMLHLFGRPGPTFEAAYGTPETGAEVRRAVYQVRPEQLLPV